MVMGSEYNFEYDPQYTIQSYFWFPQVQTQANKTSNGKVQIGFINTDKGGLGLSTDPAGGTLLNNVNETIKDPKNPDLIYASLTKDGELTTENVLVPMFADEHTTYQENPQIKYMNRLYNGLKDDETGEDIGFNKNYTLSQIWVYQQRLRISLSVSALQTTLPTAI